MHEQPTDVRYSLHIRRYDSYQTFDSLEELREEVGRYFTASEKASGIVDRLTSFMMQNECPGYWTGQQKYQDFAVTCDVFFPAFDDPSIHSEVSNKRIPLKQLIGEKKTSLDSQISAGSEKARRRNCDVEKAMNKPTGR